MTAAAHWAAIAARQASSKKEDAFELPTTTFGPLDKYVAANDNNPDALLTLKQFEAEGGLSRYRIDERHGDWMQTATGRKFWPMDPRPEEVFIEDIAHSLAMQCRYAGHCLRFYSVAEHSVLIARHLAARQAPAVALWALLHDASEAYLVDVPRPVKPYLTGYKDAEEKVMGAVCSRFGLPVEMPAEVHAADSRIIADELANMVPMDWHARHDDPLGVRIRFWSPEKASEEFLATFEALSGRQDRRAAA